MHLTIVKDDNAVIVDGTRHTVDCGSLADDVHAVQWDGDHGEVEYRMTRCDHCGARSKKGNSIISDVSAYAPLVDAWRTAYAEAEAARIEAERVEAERIAAIEAEGQAHAPRPAD